MKTKKKASHGTFIIMFRESKRIPLWLLSALLYGFSWSNVLDINLSILAWLAFVPLFYYLEKKDTFLSFYLPSLAFTALSYFIICHGFLFTRRDTWLVIIGAVDELVMASLLFALFYPFKKYLGYPISLLIFPFLTSIWEWSYQKMEHTYGYLMLSHSQSQNIWLIQFIDMFGVWSIACWVMIANVFLYFLIKYRYRFKTRSFRNGAVVFGILLFAFPLVYSYYRISEQDNKASKSIRVTLIGANFTEVIKNRDDMIDKIERLTYMTDSADYMMKQKGLKSDLYVWSEGAIEFGNDTIVRSFIDTAVTDWGTPLLSGMISFPNDTTQEDNRMVNRAGIYTETRRNHTSFIFYDKIHLAPGPEMLPYHKFLAKIPYFPVPLHSLKFYRKGFETTTLAVNVPVYGKVKVGTPICHEQNYPETWASMSLKGAECFIQLSSEVWWRLDYFRDQMANITRLRCIENRRGAARCSNGGVTCFFDPCGRKYSALDSKEGALCAELPLNEELTFFTMYQYFFPFLCLAVIVLLSGLSRILQFSLNI